MGYDSILIQAVVFIGLMIIWAVWEYRQRENRHEKTILDLRNGAVVNAGPRLNWGKVTTTFVVSFLLLAMIAGTVITVGRFGPLYAGPLLLWALELALVAVLLLMMAVRDTKKLREG